MIYGASDLARRLLDRTDDQVRDVFLRDLAAIFPELPGLVTEIEVQRWLEGIPFSAPGRHRWHPVFEQPVGRVHLAGDWLGAPGGMDTAALVGVLQPMTPRRWPCCPAPRMAGGRPAAHR
jgi:predicted NAD/FAD-dependent oxidoreductase